MEREKYQESMIEKCKELLQEPTRFNLRRLFVIVECLKDLDSCTVFEREEVRLAERRSNR